VFNGRKRLISALAGLALAASIGLVPGTASADPDIDDVEKRVDDLYHEAEAAQERYHDIKLELDELRADLRSLESDQARQGRRMETAQEQVRESVIRQYQGENLSAVGQVFVSEDPGAFLDQLSTMTSYNDLQSQMFSAYAREAKALDIRSDATQTRLDDIAAAEQKLAEELLSRLEAEERERMTASRSTTALPDVAASGSAGAAVQFAMAQVGDAYVYGAAGPDAYDCSGLTMAAWAAAGVALPHSSSAQYGSGPHISASALQPGDLVFYYSPISHVGMYIGNGMIVHAANPGTGVAVAGLYSMPYVGAVRPG
jgi:cell wall-associated NlpC family hydrolase